MLFGKKLKKPDLEKEKALRDEIEKNGGLEKNDMLAMILSACLVIIPVVLLVLAILVLFIFLLI